MSRTYRVADLFCGAGGTSSGAARAVAAMGGALDLVAVNHWDVAIATHSRNHPSARHHCINLDAARPEAIVPEGSLDLLMASPECVFFSRARGGKPIHDQARMSAWHVQRWASALDIKCILVENVAEFRDWGPLLPSGRPDRSQKGLYFQAWIQALWAMGYAVEWRLLNAADFGDATTRTRLFVQARKDGKPIRWPEPTHSATGGADLFGGLPRWRAAREVIDWSHPGPSLLTRKRPLSVKTRLRIARGLQRFGGVLAPYYIRLLDLPAEDVAPSGEPTPFVVANRNNNVPTSADEPLRTATSAGGGGLFVASPTVEPFVLGQHGGAVARSSDQPLPTIATDGAISLTTPIIAPYYGTGVAATVDEPLQTVTTRARFGLATPLVVPYGPRAEARPTDEPLPTILTKDRLGVCTPMAEPFIVPQFGERDDQAPRMHSIDQPIPAVTSHGAGALVSPVVVQIDQSGRWGPSVRSSEEPLPTLTTTRSLALASPILEAVEAQGVDPRRLILIDGAPYLLDIRFRMLTNAELARAMGFDDETLTYEFTGNVGQVTKQIGNAVCVNLAAALVRAVLDEAPVVTLRRAS